MFLLMSSCSATLAFSMSISAASLLDMSPMKRVSERMSVSSGLFVLVYMTFMTM